MIVLDASAVLELLLGTERGRAVAEAVANPTVDLHAPHLIDIEVAQVLGRYVRDGDLGEKAAKAALDELVLLDLERHAHDPLLDRVWALRHNVSAYAAAYIALAEALDTVLLTCDRRLARSPGLARRVECIE